ncbi:hypothetical protein Ancab_037081 [Ancistrocladus abbreviatus]
MAVKMSAVLNGDSVHFREVWNDNLEEEFGLIRRIVDDYPYIAMDTEFPGVVLCPIGNFKNNIEFTFQSLKANVDRMRGWRVEMDLACPERFTDGEDIFEVSSGSVSELQLQILAGDSELDFSEEYTPSLWLDTGSEFSDKSFDSTPSYVSLSSNTITNSS